MNLKEFTPPAETIERTELIRMHMEARREFHKAHLSAIDAVEAMHQANKKADALLESFLFPSF
jgi:hypothetical protein